MTTEEGVAAVERALTILGAWRDGDGALPLREIHKRTGLYKSTILRLLASLERFRCVERQADGNWALGPALFHWGTLYRSSATFGPVVSEHLERLANTAGESATFWVPQGNTRLCVFRVAAPGLTTACAMPGEHRPLQQGVSGAVLCSGGQGLPDGVVTGIACPSVDDIAVSAPVFGVDGELRGALTLLGPMERLGMRIDHIKPMVRDAAADLSRALAASRR